MRDLGNRTVIEGTQNKRCEWITSGEDLEDGCHTCNGKSTKRREIVMIIAISIFGVIVGALLLWSLKTVLDNRFIDSDGRLKTRTCIGRVIDIDTRPKQ